MKIPKIFAHTSYIGTTGYNNHARDFFRELSNTFKIKVRNFTVPKYFSGWSDEPFNNEDYLQDIDKKMLTSLSLWETDDKLIDKEIYTKFGNEFNHNVNIILSECNHHYFYQQYDGPKIGYVVWETTRYPDQFFQKLQECDQLWVASNWQRDCVIEQGMEASKVKVVPEAVDGNTFKPNSKATLPEYDDGRFKFLIFGRWDYRKSTKEIMEAFFQEFSEDEPVDLVVSIDNLFARDGFETTEKRLEHYNLLNPRVKVKHFPTREEYIKYLQKGHVFLSCARSEGWNLPLIEAMACGTPSIYSNCSGQLEFAEGKGLPVKIKKMIPALGGEYSSYSQSEVPGEFYEPDFEDLKKVMRDAYVNYKKHKKRALKESKDIIKKFTWKNAAEISHKYIKEVVDNAKENITTISFQNGPKVEVTGYNKNSYFVEFINKDTNQILHSGTIENNMWIKCSKEYYIPWIIKINGKKMYELDLKNKIVKISFDTKSIGDTLAYLPQVLEFQKKHKCAIVVSTFYNDWFRLLPVYQNLKFIEPDIPHDCIAEYTLGSFQDDNGNWNDGTKNPIQPNTIPLIQVATDILGLPYKEIQHGIDFDLFPSPISGKYICIGPESTAGLKEWPYQNWKELAKKLHKKGYKVVSLTTKGFKGINIIEKRNLNWNDLFNHLYHAELFIGLGSGLSWINHNLKKHTVMINGFLPLGYEFTENITKVEDHICTCWTDKNNHFDKGNWNWCPAFEGTDLQHKCMKSITVEMVYNSVMDFLNNKK
jgi:autotransporter strand-loop-strand O-heptosyltransferase